MPVSFPLLDWDAAAIPATTAVLRNGLTVVAHRDSKTPIVAVLVAYHIGSRDEPTSKAGLAHLCEHLMFSSTRNFPENFFAPLERLGATSINAITREDYTAYFEAVPVEALDATLRLEADRMQAQAAELDQAGIDLQRAVVRNELLQRESGDYGQAPRLLAQHGYPPDHPYRHPPDGLVEDLENLTLADAYDWFRTYYGPANATLVIAGDIEPVEAIQRARAIFEEIPADSAASRELARLSVRRSKRHATISATAAASRLYVAWNVPKFGALEHAALDLSTEILAGGVASRLHKRLVAELRLAAEVGGELFARALGSQLAIWVTASPGTTLSALNTALLRELDRFRAQGPTAEEVNAGRARRYIRLIRGFERMCGPRGRAETLAIDAVMTGDANAHRRRFAGIASLRPREIRTVARQWLGDDALAIKMNAARSSTPAKPAQRAKVSRKLAAPESNSERTRAALASPRMRIVAIERHGSSLFEFRIITRGGFARDPAEKSGLAGVAMEVLTSAVSRNSESRLDAQLERLGAAVETHVRPDASVVAMSAPGSTLAASLKIYRSLVTTPKVSDALVERARESQLALIRREKKRPGDLALRILPGLVFGAGHPYAIPMTGSGTESGVMKVSKDDVREYFLRWHTTAPWTLIALGPLSAGEFEVRIGRTFAERTISKARSSDHRAIPLGKPEARIVVVDEPGRSQSAIFAAVAAEPRNSVQSDQLVVVDAFLGGLFTSRLNTNLRERRAWTYGAQTRLLAARGPRLWMASTFVPGAVTTAAMLEIEREFEALAASRPVTHDEFRRTVDCLVGRAPASRETNAMIATAIEDDLVCGLPYSHSQKLPERLRNLSADQMAKACASAIAGKSLAWLVVGDAGSFMKDLETAGLGSVEVVVESNVSALT
jgi:zinc protease